MAELEAMKELVFSLCAAEGTPGGEEPAVQAAAARMARLGQPERGGLGSVWLRLGNPEAPRRVLIDGHIDQIGLIVTSVDKDGFLRVASCGGADNRTLPGLPVLVRGRETLAGVVCCTPPHLASGDADAVPRVEDLAVDVGLSKEEAERLVSPGDRVLFCAQPQQLLGTRVTAPALDDRAGCAVVLRAAELAAAQGVAPDVCAVFLCSTREETGGQGASTAAYTVEPTESIVVDVSFAQQPGVPAEKSGKLGGGPMLGMSPVLDRAMGRRLAELAKARQIPFQYEVMGGSVGTNADGIGVTRGGVACAMLSVPQRYMHTPVEVVDLQDLEWTAQLIAAYVGRAE